ncbi:MAG: Fe(3+) ABC transporter substrate-binding protein [Planctomycetota bacterium]
MSHRLSILRTLALLAFFTIGSRAEEVVNVYSARHYDTDDKLYQAFEKKTGIKVKIIEGGSDGLIERIKREGKRSPADVFITVDAGRLDKAEKAKILAEVESPLLSKRVPAHLRHPQGLWFGLTQRVRVLIVSKERVAKDAIARYEELADPKWKGRVLIRSSTNVYNQSLVGSLIQNLGDKKAKAWCEGVVANLARKPQGGDRDQIRGVASGEADVAVSNHYYFARMLGSDKKADRDAANACRLVFPNQKDRGAHVNVSGAGVVKTAPNRANAIKFIEFLVSDEAQKVFSAGNNEYPVVQSVSPPAVLKQFGKFKADSVSAYKFGNNNKKAILMMNAAKWR